MFFFFFKQKTAYEMRISDWSSDVCSSDLLYAEDPALDYRPTVGTLTAVHFPPGVRAESWCMAGSSVSAWYDPMLAKLIVHAPTREAAIAAMRAALDESRIDGIETNLRRSEEQKPELQSLMRIQYAVFCLKKQKYNKKKRTQTNT